MKAFNQVEEHVLDKIWFQVGNRADDQAWNQVRYQVWSEVENQVWNQVCDQVWGSGLGANK